MNSMSIIAFMALGKTYHFLKWEKVELGFSERQPSPKLLEYKKIDSL